MATARQASTREQGQPIKITAGSVDSGYNTEAGNFSRKSYIRGGTNYQISQRPFSFKSSLDFGHTTKIEFDTKKFSEDGNSYYNLNVKDVVNPNRKQKYKIE